MKVSPEALLVEQHTAGEWDEPVHTALGDERAEEQGSKPCGEWGRWKDQQS